MGLYDVLKRPFEALKEHASEFKAELYRHENTIAKNTAPSSNPDVQKAIDAVKNDCAHIDTNQGLVATVGGVLGTGLAGVKAGAGIGIGSLIIEKSLSCKISRADLERTMRRNNAPPLQ